jgi:DNA polymerase-1
MNQPMPSSYQTLYLIDISSFIFRAFYAVRELTAPDGTPVNAVYGVASMLGRLMDEAKPEHLVVVYDSKEPSFRKEMYTEYKANRSAPPDLLLPQFDLIEELIKLMGIPSYRQSGVEADDLIATLTKRWVANDPAHRVVVVSGDKDLMALVTGKVQVWDTMKDKHFTPHEVIEKFGVNPDQVRDYLAIVGDSSDNIPGITGIGPKGAEILLKEFGTLEGIIAGAKAGKIKGKKSQTIIEGEEKAKLSQKLATLKEDCELEVDPTSTKYQFKVSSPLLDFCKKYALKSLYSKYSTMGAGAGIPVHHGESESGVPMNAAGDDEANHSISFDFGENTTAGPARESHSIQNQTKAGSSGQATSATRAPVYRSDDAKEYTSQGESELHASTRQFVKREPKFHTVDTPAKLEALLAKIHEKKRFGFDTETTSLNPRKAELVGISIAVDTENGYYIPVGHTERLDQKVEQLELAPTLAKLKPILENPEYKKIGQNIKYDFRVMLNQGVHLHGIEGDTMVAAYALDSSGRHGLDFLAQKYLGYSVISYEDVVGKGAAQISFADVPIDRATTYSGEDAWATFTLWEEMKPKLISAGVEKLFLDVDLPIAEMEETGIKVDVPFLKELDVRFTQELAELEKKILGFTSSGMLNVNSPKQLGVFLFEELKLPTQGKTKTGFSTDASVLATLATLHEAPRLILEYREVSKLKGTYVLPLQELRDPKDFRIRTSFNLTGTATGRLSSSDPNLQNIPTRTKRGQLIRQAFIAEEGSVLMSADYSQIELRILAHLSGDENLSDSFRKGEDVHRRTASEIFHVSTDAVTDQQRSYAKAINFGLMYGKSAFGLAEELSISRSDAKKMIDQYFTRYKKVREYLDDAIINAKETGGITTLLGRKRALPEIRSANHMMRANAERMAMNSPIQGTASDLIKIAMVRLEERLKSQKLKSKLLLQVHDELVLECRKDELEKVQALVVETMENALTLSVPLKVNVGIGANWAEL